jgi:hypothetical protein
MNAKKCAYTLFSKQPDVIRLNLSFNNELIPYNSNPVFLGITLDERLNFAKHFENLQSRAFKRINIIKIFCHKSWHLNHSTLLNIYRALIGSIFNYSFFYMHIINILIFVIIIMNYNCYDIAHNNI